MLFIFVLWALSYMLIAGIVWLNFLKRTFILSFVPVKQSLNGVFKVIPKVTTALYLNYFILFFDYKTIYYISKFKYSEVTYN